MTIQWRFDEAGGFTAADLQSGVTAYAHPTSRNAVRADQPGTMAPVQVAEAMLTTEARNRLSPFSQSGHDAANRERLEAGRDGSTVTRQSGGETYDRERISMEAEADAIRTQFPGYDPNAPGSDLTARRVTGEASEDAGHALPSENRTDYAALAAEIIYQDEAEDEQLATLPEAVRLSILYRMDDEGGFTVANTGTGLTSYAYPSSDSAEEAKDHPKAAALEMEAREARIEAVEANRDHPELGDAFRAKDRERMAELRAGLRDGSTKEIPAPREPRTFINADVSEKGSSVILYRTDAAGHFIVGNTITRETGDAHEGGEIAREALTNPEGAAREMARVLALHGSVVINAQGEDARAFPQEQEAAWQSLEAGRLDGSTKELPPDGPRTGLDQRDGPRSLTSEARLTSEPGLPEIGAPADQAEDHRRRATDSDRPGPTSRIEDDIIQGLGRKIEREQREIYHTKGMSKAEKSAALDKNLARNIEALDRPAVTAARAIDSGKIRARHPLVEATLRGMTPEQRRAFDIEQTRMAQRDRSDDYSRSG